MSGINGGEALGPVKVQCPSVGECQGEEAGVGGWMGMGAPVWKQGERGWEMGFLEEKLGKGITFEMQISKIFNKNVKKRKYS